MSCEISGVAGTHPLGIHSEIGPLGVSRNRIFITCGFKQVIKMADGANLVIGKHPDGKVADDDENDKRMNIIREECGFYLQLKKKKKKR